MSGAAQHPSREEREAARQYLEHDYAAHHLKGEPARIANENAKAIDEKHERARDIALTGTAKELGQLPSHLRNHQMRSRKQAGITAQHAARIRAGYRTPPPSHGGHGGGRSRRAPSQPPAPPAPRTLRSSAGDAGRTVASTAGDMAGAAGDTALGGLVVQVFAWGMGLSLLYLVLRNARGLGRITTGVANATRAVVAVNVDPLNPHGVLVKGASKP